MSFTECLADIVMLAHAAFSLFVVMGLVFILTGQLLGWSWTNHPRFRAVHLAATLIVVARVWLGVPCWFSIAEDGLRSPAPAPCPLSPEVHQLFHRLAFRGEETRRFAHSTTMVGLIAAATFVWSKRHCCKIRLDRTQEIA